MHVTLLQNLQVLLPCTYFILAKGPYIRKFMSFGSSGMSGVEVVGMRVRSTMAGTQASWCSGQTVDAHFQQESSSRCSYQSI